LDPSFGTTPHWLDHAAEANDFDVSLVLMWFAWSFVLEAADVVCGRDGQHQRRALMLAGVASGCPADFIWRGHRRSRSTYAKDQATKEALHSLGLAWAGQFDEGANEVHALFRIRE
jgi:hypothetical protein